MMSDFKLKFKQLYEKIKKVKHIEIYLACGLAVIVALIYFGSVATTQKQIVTRRQIKTMLHQNF